MLSAASSTLGRCITPAAWKFLHLFPIDFLQVESPSLLCEGGNPGTWFLPVPGLGVWVSRCQLKVWTTWEEQTAAFQGGIWNMLAAALFFVLPFREESLSSGTQPPGRMWDQGLLSLSYADLQAIGDQGSHLLRVVSISAKDCCLALLLPFSYFKKLTGFNRKANYSS